MTGGDIQILEMRPVKYSDGAVYSTEITLVFNDGIIPHLFNLLKLTKKFWMSAGNDKKVTCFVEYRWPVKCRTCKSESHVSASCPWLKIEIGGRKPNLLNCRFHLPGWVEPIKGKGRSAPKAAVGFMISPKKGKLDKGGKGAGKGKGRAKDPATTPPS